MKYISPELATNYKSTFLSCEKDQELIWRKLLFESKPYSDKLKRLLVINTPDCLDEKQYQYQTQINKITLQELHDKGYITTIPRLKFYEHDEMRSCILLQFDNITPSYNPAFRDFSVTFTVLCNLEQWELDDYKVRPYQIAGYIDGILNGVQLTGIGRLEFLSASVIGLNEDICGLVLVYNAVHGNPDDTENIDNTKPALQNLGIPASL